MGMWLKLGLLALSLALVWSLEDGDLISLKTPRGTLIGFRADYGTNKSALYYGKGDVFLGIPFAEPPLGEKRFQKPTPVCKYPENPWNATYYRTSCPQITACSSSPMSEDCLYLNVFSPNVKSLIKYPVMVWIHGGAFINGCAQQFPHKGAIRNLVSRGVVVVTLQYRLGVAGFFTTYTDDFPPNRGILDQVEAIKWVKDNIEYFGGNPNKVTLFGNSGGGASISAHSYSPLSQNLFQQAILQSGTVLTAFEGSLGFTNTSAKRAGQLCGFSYDRWVSNDWTGLKECMLNKTHTQFSALEAGNFMGWKITQDSYFFPGTPQDLAPLRPNIPIIIGSVRDEFSFFLLERLRAGLYTQASLNETFFNNLFTEFTPFYGDRLPDVKNILTQVYNPYGLAADDASGWFKLATDVFTGAAFTAFNAREADFYLANGNTNVYLWEQSYQTKIAWIWTAVTSFLQYKPVPHTAELSFVWMQERLWQLAQAQGVLTDFDYQLADWYGEKWTNFAKFGRPTLFGEWKPVAQRGANRYYKVDKPEDGGMRMEAQYRFIDDITYNRVIPGLVGVLPPNRPDYNNGTNPLPTAEIEVDLARMRALQVNNDFFNPRCEPCRIGPFIIPCF